MMVILFIDYFMTRLKEVIIDLENLMYIDLRKYLQILLTNVLPKACLLVVITEDY